MRRVWTGMLLALYSALAVQASAGDTLSLGGEWNLSYWPQPAVAVTSPDGMKGLHVERLKARVPGNVEIDLERAGLIGDPMVGSQVDSLRPWEGMQWCYSRTFEAPAIGEGERAVLHFGGIDCLADVWLNGQHVGRAENMLIPHDFDVTPMLRPQRSNRLQVILRSAVMSAQEHLLGSFSIMGFASVEGIYLRKAPHMYGWDILPRLVSAGLWRDVELRVQGETAIRNVHYWTRSLDVAGRKAVLQADVQLTLPFRQMGKARAVFRLLRQGRQVAHAEQVINTPAMRQHITISEADLWWPRGMGEAALYDAEVQIVDSSGTTLARKTERIGIRQVRLERNDINLPDAPGKFRFYVNGQPVFIHGTNWVPLDALHSRDAQHYDRCISMAADLNCNMIRCWGGNVYEDDRFYDLCDSCGILVWQDFSMGCAFYPQRDDFARAIEEEATSVVLRLRNHPCLALWAGNNEDDCVSVWNGSLWDPNRDRISREVLPRVLYEFDLTRPYLPSSPYLSETAIQRGWNENELPEAHLWGPRGYYKAPYYTAATNAFVSEIGYHGCPNRASLERMMTPGAVYPWTKDFEWNEEWLTKSVRRFPSEGKTFERNNLMINQIREVFGTVPRELDDFIFASQSVQGEAMKYFMEMWRGQKFDHHSGLIWWNLRDGWPLISDAIVDYYYGRKRAYWYLRNAQRNVCLFINDAREGGYPLMAANETLHDAQGTVTVTDVATETTVYDGTFQVPANDKAQVALLPEQQGQGLYLIIYSTEGRTERNHYLYGKPPYDLTQYQAWMAAAGIVPAG